MAPTLLDLTDETIQRIAYFANRDSRIPIPSYGAHWQNFKGDIRARHCRDVLSFRLSCKRIHQACKLKNIHLFISEYKTMTKWLNNAPVEAEKSITRLRIHLNDDGGAGFSAWTSLTGLFNALCNLEELVITATPTCGSYYRCQPGMIETRPRIPRYPILANLKSLSITLRCHTCAVSLPLSLIPAAKNLQHLKIRLVGLRELYREDEINNNNSSNTNDDDMELKRHDPVERIRQLINVWCDSDNNRRNQLKSLFLRYPILLTEDIQSGYPKTIKQILESVPMLENLRITQYHPNSDYLASGIKVMARKKSHRWELRVKKKSSSDTVDEDNITTLDDILHEFGTHKNLKYFDPIIAVDIKHIPSMNHTALHYTTLRSFLRSRPLDEEYEEDVYQIRKHRQDMEEAMTQIANSLIEHFPSLEGGALWELGTNTNDLDWYRWEWSKKKVNQHGKSAVIIDKFPWHLTREFLGSKEGLRTPRRSIGGHSSTSSSSGSDTDSYSDFESHFDPDSEDD